MYKVSEIIKGGTALNKEKLNQEEGSNTSSTVEEEIEENELLTDPVVAPQTEENTVSSSEPPIRPTPSISHSMNTEINDGGIMIGDVPVSSTPPVVIDDWSVPAPVENIIPVGGRVKMGGSKGEKK